MSQLAPIMVNGLYLNYEEFAVLPQLCGMEINDKLNELSKTLFIISSLSGLLLGLAITALFLYLFYIFRIRSGRSKTGVAIALANLAIVIVVTIVILTLNGQQTRAVMYITWILVWGTAYLMSLNMLCRSCLVIRNETTRQKVRLMLAIATLIYALGVMSYALYLTSKVEVQTTLGEFQYYPKFNSYAFIGPVIYFTSLHISFLIYGFLFLVPNEQKASGQVGMLSFIFNASAIFSLGTVIVYVLLCVFLFVFNGTAWYAPLCALCPVLANMLEYLVDHIIFLKVWTGYKEPTAKNMIPSSNRNQTKK